MPALLRRLSLVMLVSVAACGDPGPVTPDPGTPDAGGNNPPQQPAALTLVSSVPADGASNIPARTTTFTLNFSEPVNPATFGVTLTQADGTNVRTSWTVTGSTATVTVDAARLAFATGYKIALPDAIRSVAGGSFNARTLAFTTQPVGTNVTADLTEDTTFTLAGSPYVFDSPQHVYLVGSTTRTVTLTVEPGVEVYGELLLSGNALVRAQGTESAPVYFVDGAFIQLFSRAPSFTELSTFSHCVFQSFLPMGGWSDVRGAAGISHARISFPGSQYADAYFDLGAGYLEDSLLTFTHAKGIRGSQARIERNAIAATAGVLFDTDRGWSSYSKINNNHIDGTRTTFLARGSLAPMLGNTFANVQANSIVSSVGTTEINLSGNYWGTTDLAAIATRIFDKYDDATRCLVKVAPVLTAPADATPVP